MASIASGALHEYVDQCSNKPDVQFDQIESEEPERLSTSLPFKFRVLLYDRIQIYFNQTRHFSLSDLSSKDSEFFLKYKVLSQRGREALYKRWGYKNKVELQLLEISRMMTQTYADLAKEKDMIIGLVSTKDEFKSAMLDFLSLLSMRACSLNCGGSQELCLELKMCNNC